MPPDRPASDAMQSTGAMTRAALHRRSVSPKPARMPRQVAAGIAAASSVIFDKGRNRQGGCRHSNREETARRVDGIPKRTYIARKQALADIYAPNCQYHGSMMKELPDASTVTCRRLRLMDSILDAAFMPQHICSNVLEERNQGCRSMGYRRPSSQPWHIAGARQANQIDP